MLGSNVSNKASSKSSANLFKSSINTKVNVVKDLELDLMIGYANTRLKNC